jgi:sortase A
MNDRKPHLNWLKLIIFVCLCGGFGSLAKGGYMAGKAQLAQYLIANAWLDRNQQSRPVQPWPWADIHAVAKIEVPELETEQYVMNDASGEALAFGPGQMRASLPLGDTGHSVIAGHRDSHFKFLQDIELGHTIETENYRGRKTRYQVVDIDIIDSNKEQIPLHDELNLLTLVTCYPFDQKVPGGSLRYLVTAAEF